MKKLFFALVTGLVIGAAGFSGFKVYDNYRMSKYSSLMLENLEMLTRREGEITLDCWQTFSDSGPATHKTYCVDCEPHLCGAWKDASTCTTNN